MLCRDSVGITLDNVSSKLCSGGALWPFVVIVVIDGSMFSEVQRKMCHRLEIMRGRKFALDYVVMMYLVLFVIIGKCIINYVLTHRVVFVTLIIFYFDIVFFFIYIYFFFNGGELDCISVFLFVCFVFHFS